MFLLLGMYHVLHAPPAYGNEGSCVLYFCFGWYKAVTLGGNQDQYLFFVQFCLASWLVAFGVYSFYMLTSWAVFCIEYFYIQLNQAYFMKFSLHLDVSSQHP